MFHLESSPCPHIVSQSKNTKYNDLIDLNQILNFTMKMLLINLSYFIYGNSHDKK